MTQKNWYLVIRRPEPGGVAQIDAIYENSANAEKDIAERVYGSEGQSLWEITKLANKQEDLLNSTFSRLPLQGDDNDCTPQSVQGLPSLRFSKSGSNYVNWSLRAPAVGASGVRLEFGWTPAQTRSGSVVFDVMLSPLASGVDLGSINTLTNTLHLAESPAGGSWQKDTLYVNSVAVDSALGALQQFNIELRYDGPASSINRNVQLLNSAIKFTIEEN